MNRVMHVSKSVNIPGPGQKPPGGLDEVVDIRIDGYDMVRVGLSGCTFSGRDFDIDKDVHTTIRDGVKYITIDLPQDLYSAFCDGTTNGVIWPLLHRRHDLAEGAFSHDDNAMTREVNEIFAKVIGRHGDPGDTIIVHDYHFFELGKILRDDGINNPTGFFLHTPAFSFDILSNIPQDQQDYVYGLLDSMYAYDLVGVQAKRDLDNLFDLTARNTAPKENEFYKTYEAVRKGQVAQRLDIGVFPVIGKSEHYLQQAILHTDGQSVRDFIKKTGATTANEILTYGRLDYSKGLTNQNMALSIAFAKSAISPRNTHFTQVAAWGSRAAMAYHIERARVEQTNKMLCNTWNPIAERNVASLVLEAQSRDRVILPFAREDRVKTLLVTSDIDGANLTGYEYLAVQKPENPGIVVLSKTVGAADVLGDTVVRTDPLQPHDIANCIETAVHMPLKTRQEMHAAALEAMKFNSNERWHRELIGMTQAGAQKKYQAPAPASASRPAVG